MKFVIEKNTDKNEYDELMYILENIKRIHKNPNKKVKLFTKNYILLFIIEALILLLNIFLLNNGKFWYIYFGIIIMIILISIILFINGLLKIKYYQKNSRDTTISVNKDEILMDHSDYLLKYKWDDIKYIIANKYSICIIPKVLPGLVMCFPTYSKDDIIKMINKFKKENLFIDNTDLYK